MTTKSSIRTFKSSSNSVNNMTTNGNEVKSSRICIKKPVTNTNFLPSNSTSNGFSSHLKKRTLQLNNFFHSKIKSNHSNEQPHAQPSTEHSTSPSSHIFHAIAPASSEEINNLSKQSNEEQKSQNASKTLEKSTNDPTSSSGRRIAHILAHTNIKAMAITPSSNRTLSSCSDNDEGKQTKFSSKDVDGDADESDEETPNKPKKSRRIQKPRKSSNSSLHQKSENHHDKHKQEQLSSNEDEHKELNGINERKTKSSLTKISDPSTTDDDQAKTYYSYHPLDNLESKSRTTTTESNLSSPIPTMSIPTNQLPVKKITRFQIKPIRKSQQQILLHHKSTTKSSVDDDSGSLSQSRINSQIESLLIERKNANTPTTDGENSVLNTDNIINLNGITAENGHHRVRFQATPHGKQESATEEEKIPSQSVATVVLPSPAPPSSTVSMQGDDDEEEEAIAKSPDNRFIKYAKEIGRGAFKTVYRGLDTETSVAVAWCELQDFAQFDKHERARFKEEAEMLKKLQHPNIVRFYDFWEETNPRTNKKVIILVTELMTSGSLKGYIRKFKGQKEEKRINVMKKWCRQILKGLAYLHSRNPPVIHRDLKCDNVFISSTTGCVKIGDLGLATFKTQTFAKSMRGTMEFMAPEMFDEQYDELVDIYSFGLCMLEMITGEYPYIECKGPTAVIKRVTAGLKPDCYYKVEGEDVREVIDCCIRTNKAERLSVHDLLQHSFFLDDNGLRIDFVRDPGNDLQGILTNNFIDLKLKIIDKTKRKTLWTEHEAIRFRYNYTSETPEQIVEELIEKKYILDDDKKFVLQSIKDRLRGYQCEQMDRKAGVFFRDPKHIINHTPQSSMVGHQQQQQQQQPIPVPQQQQPATPIITQTQVVPAPSNTPIPSLIQQPPVEVQQQIAKPSTEVSQIKPIIATEPISIAPLSELSTSVSGSAGSLEKLDAALKITLFNKTKSSRSVSTTSAITNDTTEPLTPLMNPDDSSIFRLGNDVTISDQRPIKDTGGPIPTNEITTNVFPSSTLQTQSQPATMLINHQSSILQNPLLSTQTPQSISYSTITPSTHLINTALSNDAQKQLIPSSSSVTTETIENSHMSISPSHTIEPIQPSLTSDTSQPPIIDSLKHLDALLKNALKNSSKTTGTAQNSDTETANPTVSLPISHENSIKPLEIESDEVKQKLLDQLNPLNLTVSPIYSSQSSTSTLVLPTPIQQSKPHPTNQIGTYSDSFTSSDRNICELETLFKSPYDKSSSSNDDTIIAPPSSSSNDLSDVKLMIMDLSKTLLNRMNIIENKIDEHRNQTIQISNLLSTTVLPSIVDLADIIQETPNLDSRVRTKLENIQTNIRSTQQQTQIKDLMET